MTLTHEERIHARTRLMQLHEKTGTLEPTAVVEDARPKNSSLHGYFEWNDRIAAEKHRLDQARDLIQSVHVTVQIENVKIVVPMYIRDPDAGAAQGYKTVFQLQDKHEVARRALDEELDRVESVLDRAVKLSRVLGLEELSAPLIGQVARLREALGQAAG